MSRIICLTLLATLAACGRGTEDGPSETKAPTNKPVAESKILAYPPSEEFLKLAPAAPTEGLFLTEDEAPANALQPENIAPVAEPTATPEPTPNLKPLPSTSTPPARIEAVGGAGFYQKTAQGYQYYSGANQPTSWFGQPGSSGSWTLTQGTLPAGSKTYAFGTQPSLAMNQNASCGCGTWQTYNPQTKTLNPVASSSFYKVTYDPSRNANPWATQVYGGSTGKVVQFGSWLPTGQPSLLNGANPLRSSEKSRTPFSERVAVVPSGLAARASPRGDPLPFLPFSGKGRDQ